MSQNTLNPLSKSQDAVVAPSRRIVELPMRLFHTFLALSFAGAYVTSESERFRIVHVSLGYTLVGLIVFRILWGLIGPRQSRLSAIWRKFQGIQDFKDDFKTFPASLLQWNGQTLRKLASVVLSAAALLTFGVSFFIAATGYAVYNEMTGDWMAEVHEFFGNSFLILVLVHVAVVALLVVGKKSQGLRPMWSGRREGLGPDVAKTNHLVVGWMLALGVLAFLVFQLA
ncbi:MAG: cytochrome b/b6 domain-containing protein [Burkholderiales bacterium]|jgi:cytochrome b|nr:cytochrome b/b6 domain-containing protein [Burkholderiales bacterium]